MYADALAAIEAIEAVKVGDEPGGALRLVAVATYLSLYQWFNGISRRNWGA